MTRAARGITQAGNGSIDLNSEAFFHNPYKFYSQLRSLGAPYWLPHTQLNSNSPGMWLFTGYEDAAEILKNYRSVSKQITRVRGSNSCSPMDFNLLNQDPPAHTRLRSLVNYAFTPNPIKSLESWIEHITEGLVDKMREQGQIDFVQAFSRQLPVMVLAGLLGIPLADHEKFRTWSNNIIVGYDSVVANAELLLKQQTAMQELIIYFNWLIKERRDNPQDDLISAMIIAQEDNSSLSSNELVGMCILFLVAGHETTTNLLGNGLLTLLQHPGQLTLLKRNPEYLPSAIEEMLRFESPAQRSTFRITSTSCVIGGRELKEGEQICAVIGSANRDPAKFPNPDNFDITRSPNQHLSFGMGIHFCIGASLARTEARIAFKNILGAFPDISLATDTPDWHFSTFFRGLKSLAVSLHK